MNEEYAEREGLTSPEIDEPEQPLLASVIPTNVTPGLQAAIDAIAKNLFGTTLTDSREAVQCVACGEGPLLREDFEDQCSWEEYEISGLCQDCQDGVFTEPEEAEIFPPDWGIPTRFEDEYPEEKP